MLLPEDVMEFMKEQQIKFTELYSAMLSEMHEVATERGRVRDKDTPIFIRRSPEENLGIAHGKVYRVESLLAQVAAGAPNERLLKKVQEECIDIANYVLFIAVLAEMVRREK